MPVNLGETFCTSIRGKVGVDVPDFDIFVWAKGLQDMLSRDPHGTETYISWYQLARSSSICNITHHGVKVVRSRQRLQSRDVSKCPQVSTCVKMHEVQANARAVDWDRRSS